MWVKQASDDQYNNINISGGGAEGHYLATDAHTLYQKWNREQRERWPSKKLYIYACVWVLCSLEVSLAKRLTTLLLLFIKYVATGSGLLA